MATGTSISTSGSMAASPTGSTRGRRAAPRSPPPSAAPFPDVWDNPAMSFADLDGDGDLDAMLGGQDARTFFVQNTGTATAPAFAAPETNPFGLGDVGVNSRPTLGDLDGDGDLDALVGRRTSFSAGARSSSRTRRSRAPAFAPPQTNPFGLADVPTSRRLPELPGLRRGRRFRRLSVRTASAIYAFRNTGSARAPPSRRRRSTRSASRSPRMPTPSLRPSATGRNGGPRRFVTGNNAELIAFENTGTRAPQRSPTPAIGSVSSPGGASSISTATAISMHIAGIFGGSTGFTWNTGIAECADLRERR